METTVEVADPSHVAETRRAVTLIGHSTKLPEERVAQASLVTSELATNLLKYAKGGTITVSTVEGPGGPLGFDVVAVDRGPGIANLDAALADGHSTGGSLGIGLGTVRRAATVFDLYTQPGLGTAIFVRVLGASPRGEGTERFQAGARAAPMRGEQVSGDAWSTLPFGESLAVTVVDGLGHGPKAAIAATAAVETFRSRVRLHGPARTLQIAHEVLRPTRGAVMAVGIIDRAGGALRFASIGNIGAVVLDGSGVLRLSATDGTVGYGNRTARESEYAWTDSSVLVLNSDGLSNKWNLAAHPGLLGHHPMLIAAVLHRDFGRDTDDATVLVIKNAPS